MSLKAGGESGARRISAMIDDMVEFTARLLCWTGGGVVIFLIILTCVSVLGRAGTTLAYEASDVVPWAAGLLKSSGIGPIIGDFELIEVGTAFAVFTFLPICQIRGGHAAVDLFAGALPQRFYRALIAFWEVGLAMLLVMISVRLYDATFDKFRYGETSYLLQFPIWWSYAASSVASTFAALIGIYCAYRRLIDLWRGVAHSDGEVF